jgi:hypothetical protein
LFFEGSDQDRRVSGEVDVTIKKMSDDDDEYSISGAALTTK